MTSIQFDECNVEYGKGQPEYQPLPAHLAEDGTVTSAWQMSEEEKQHFLKTGILYTQQLTLNKGLAPQLLSVVKPEGLNTKRIGDL